MKAMRRIFRRRHNSEAQRRVAEWLGRAADRAYKLRTDATWSNELAAFYEGVESAFRDLHALTINQDGPILIEIWRDLEAQAQPRQGG